MIAAIGTPIVQGDLAALAALAAQIDCPPAGQPAYRWDPYKLDPEDENEVAIRRWLTELTRLRTDVLARAVVMMDTITDLSRAAYMDPAAGVVSGPWLVPAGHEWFFDYGGTAVLAGSMAGSGAGYNLGRSALGVKLWSRGVATPFRVYGSFAPIFDFQLVTPDDDGTGYPGGGEGGGTATWSYSRPAHTQGCYYLTGYWEAVSSSGAAYISLAGSTAGYTLEEQWRTVSEPYEKDGETVVDVSAGYFAWWGECANPEGDRDLFVPGTGPEGSSFTFAWQASPKGQVYFVADGQPNGNKGFFFDAVYGVAGSAYAATPQPAVSEDVWYATQEVPALTVTRTVRSHGLVGTPTGGFSNTSSLAAVPLPATPQTPAETWWQASLWPVPTMRRGGMVGETFPGQNQAPYPAVSQVAADGLWVQSAADAERTMDPADHHQTEAHLYNLGWRPAVDYVQITRRQPYGTAPEVTTQIGCFRGAGAAREFVPLVTATLPAGALRQRVGIHLLPVFDNLSIGYTNAALVTVRLGNWKAIGTSVDGNGHPQPVGITSVDGTPAGVVNDLESLCRALGAA